MDVKKAVDIIFKKLNAWVEELIRMLPNILLGAVVLVLGLFIAKQIKNLSKKILLRFSHNHTLNNLFASIVHIFFIGITIFAVLSIVKLEKAVTSILAGAGIVGLALAFAFQDIAANFISGIFISFRRPLHIGDIVKISDYMGRVEEINLRDTVLRTFQGQMVIVPNKDVFQNPIENFTLLGKRRFDLVVGVSYGEDLERVRDITLNAVKGMEGLTEDEITFFYEEFGDSSINFVLRMWVDATDQPKYKQVGSQAIINIKKAYDKNDIVIPFPIRTLDFGIKGGATLSEMPVTLQSQDQTN